MEPGFLSRLVRAVLPGGAMFLAATACAAGVPSGGGLDGVRGGAFGPRPGDRWTLSVQRVVADFGEARRRGAAGWNLEMLGMSEAERTATAGIKGPVVVGVLDTGVDARCPALAGMLAPGLDFVGEEVVRDRQPPVAYTGLDGNGHGTHVAGILAAVAGSASVRILPIKAMDLSGAGEDDRIARAIDAARTWQGASGERVRILNLSIGGRTLSERLGAALRAAHAAGITIVAASGNRGRGLDFPACLSQVLAVGATTADEGLATYSNRGPVLAFVALGGDVNVPVWSAWPMHVVASDLGVSRPQTRDGGMMGTSMAAPHVAGLAARLLARRPDMGHAELGRELGRYLVDLGPPGPDAWFGAGLPLWSHVPADGRR